MAWCSCRTATLTESPMGTTCVSCAVAHSARLACAMMREREGVSGNGLTGTAVWVLTLSQTVHCICHTLCNLQGVICFSPIAIQCKESNWNGTCLSTAHHGIIHAASDCPSLGLRLSWLHTCLDIRSSQRMGCGLVAHGSRLPRGVTIIGT